MPLNHSHGNFGSTDGDFPLYQQTSVFIRAAPHASVRLLLCFTAVIFLFFHFRQPNLGRLSTDLAEIWHADRKLV